MSDQPELVCARCQPLEHQVAQLTSALRSMQVENTDLAQELAGARATLKTVERQVAYWKSEAEQHREDDPESQTITLIYDTWRRVTGHKRSKLTDERRRLIKGQMRSYQAEDLLKAINGAGLLPYVRYGKRYAFGAKDEVATQLEHCIGSKPAGRVEQNIDYYRRACRAGAERREGVYDMFLRVSAQEAVWGRLVSMPLALFEQGRDVDEIEAFLWGRLSGRDEEWDEILAGSGVASNVVPIRSEAA